MIVVNFKKLTMLALILAAPMLTKTAALNDGKQSKRQPLLSGQDIKSLKKTLSNDRIAAIVMATNKPHNITHQKFVEFTHKASLTRACDYMVALDNPSDENVHALLQGPVHDSALCNFALTNNHNELLSAYLQKRVHQIGGYPFPDELLVLSTKDMSGATTKFLVQHGADVNKSLTNTNPVLAALMRSNTAALKILLDNGASLDHALEDTEDTLELAIEHDATECLELMLDKYPDAVHKAQPLSGSTLVHRAVDDVKPSACLKTLLEKKADPDRPNADGDTPLHLTALSGDIESARLLLGYKANPNVLNGKKESPLWMAYMNEMDESVQLLLEHKADPAVGKKIKQLLPKTRPEHTVQPKGYLQARELTQEELEAKNNARKKLAEDNKKLLEKPKKGTKVKKRPGIAQSPFALEAAQLQPPIPVQQGEHSRTKNKTKNQLKREIQQGKKEHQEKFPPVLAQLKQHFDQKAAEKQTIADIEAGLITRPALPAPQARQEPREEKHENSAAHSQNCRGKIYLPYGNETLKTDLNHLSLFTIDYQRNKINGLHHFENGVPSAIPLSATESIIFQARRAPGNNGFYKVKFIYQKNNKTVFVDTKTCFPEDWSHEETVQFCLEHFDTAVINPEKCTGNTTILESSYHNIGTQPIKIIYVIKQDHDGTSRIASMYPELASNGGIL